MIKGKGIIFGILFLLELLLFRLNVSSDNHVIIELLISICNIIFVGVILLKDKEPTQKTINTIILLSFIIRNITLFLDINGIFNVFSGADTEAFYNAAIGNRSFDLNYVTILKFFVLFVGNNRFALQYINIFASLLTLILLDKSLKKVLDYKCKDFSLRKTIICLISFAPINIFLSSSLLRETIMILCNMISIYYFISWYKEPKMKYFAISALFIIISSWFHSGMIVAIFPLCLCLVLYSHKEEKIIIKKNAIFIATFVILLLFVLFRFFGPVLTSYFNRVNSIEDLTIRRDIGSTDYLNFLYGQTSIPVIIASTPLRIIYFYFSPMPWDCRSLSVLMVFLFSSTIYIYLFYRILFYKSSIPELKKMLMLFVIILSVIYSWGTWNAGTAMRHREKILPYLCILYSICERKGKNEKN